MYECEDIYTGLTLTLFHISEMADTALSKRPLDEMYLLKVSSQINTLATESYQTLDIAPPGCETIVGWGKQTLANIILFLTNNWKKIPGGSLLERVRHMADQSLETSKTLRF